MEAAAIKPAQAKNGKISLRFGDWEVRHFQSQKMTDEEFYAFCRENADLKIEQDIFGNITVMPPVSPESGNFESEVGIDVGIWNRQTQLGKTFSSSAMFTLPDGSKRMPDASWISLERYNRLSKKERQSFARIVPDFVIEVRSPSDSALPFTCSPSAHATMPITRAMNGALIMPTSKWVSETASRRRAR